MDLIKKVYQSRVFKNGLWLTILQIVNTIAPMLTIPYIMRVLGASKYGSFSIALNLIYYIQVVVEYGFAMTGARKVALAKTQKEIDKIYSSILYSRIVLTIISVFFLVGFTVLGGYDQNTVICMVILFLIVFGTTIQLTWLFQGMQEMKPITVISSISRIISLISIFLFVKTENDLYLYCFLYSLTNVIYGIVGHIIARNKYHIKTIHISLKNILNELRDGWYLFTSSAMSKIFGNIGITVLGLVTVEYEVGIYSAISKITSVAILLFLPVSQALFPYISKVFETSKTDALKIIKLVSISTVFVFSLGGLVIFLYRDLIVEIAFGSEYLKYSLLLLPLLIWMITSIINNFLGIQILVASGHQKEYSKAFTVSMLFLVIYNLILIGKFMMYGVATAQALSEITLTIILIKSISKIYRKSNKTNENIC